MHIDGDIHHIWLAAGILKKYRRSSKILTETTYKALFTTQKPRIYVPTENQLKTLLVSIIFLVVN